jgi:hypothetical protein
VNDGIVDVVVSESVDRLRDPMRRRRTMTAARFACTRDRVMAAIA